MPAYVNANNAFSTLAGNIFAGDTSFTLTVGASFPKVAGGDWSFVTFQDAANNIEIMKITAHGEGTNSFSCVRAQEGTLARAWIVGDIVECRFTAGTVATLDGVQTLTNKTLLLPIVKFSDGTLAAPGIAWANEPSTGFARIGATIMAAVVAGVNMMQWQPGVTQVNTGVLTLPANALLSFIGGGGTAMAAMQGVAASNDLYIGHGGWVNTIMFAGATPRLQVHAGGVAFYGTVTGITAAMVGLGNVANQLQIYNLRTGTAIYIGWDGALELQINATYFGHIWPLSISGSSGSCLGNAATASFASDSFSVTGISGWAYENRGTQPVYLWCTDGLSTQQYLVARSNLAVSYADGAGHAATAGSANTANFATTAGNGGVTSVNGMTGAVTISTGGGGGGTNSSIHPDSEITMADGSVKWLRDIRVGDRVKGGTGPAEVLGVWTNTLQERAVWEVATAEGAVVCTPGHLFPIMLNGARAWGAPVPEMYWANSHGRRRTVKGRGGLIDTLSVLVADDEPVHTMSPGVLIHHASAGWIPVTGLREVSVRQPAYDAATKRSAATCVNPNQPVIALHLDCSKVFYADGHAVGTLA